MRKKRQRSCTAAFRRSIWRSRAKTRASSSRDGQRLSIFNRGLPKSQPRTNLSAVVFDSTPPPLIVKPFGGLDPDLTADVRNDTWRGKRPLF
jgi:hypothetical protein